MHDDQKKELRLDLLVFAAVYGVMLIAFRGIFQNAELPGLDTPGHYAAFVKMATEYLPHGRMTGYAPEWLGGIALFRFYGPSFFALLALAWLATFKVVPLALMFRIGAFAALALVPYANWELARTWFGRPTARWALLLSLAFVFYPKAYATVGIGAGAVFWIGYLPSIVGLSLTMLALAWSAPVRESHGWRPQAVLATLIALLATGHTVSFIICFGLLALVAVLHRKEHAFLMRLGVAVGGGIIASLWWLVPFALDNALTSTETLAVDNMAVSLPQLLFPVSLPYLWLAAPMLGLVMMSGLALLWRAKKRELPVLVAVCLVIVALQGAIGRLTPNFTFHYYRIIPFAYVLLLLAAAYALGEAARTWAADVPRKRAYVGLIAVTIVGIYAFAFDFRGERDLDGMEVRDTIGWRWDAFPLAAAADEFAAKLSASPLPQRVLPLLSPIESLAALGSPHYFVSRLPMHGGPNVLTGDYAESSPLTPFALTSAEALTGGQVRFNGDHRLRYLAPFMRQSAEVQLERLRSLGVDVLFAGSQEVADGLATMSGLSASVEVAPFRAFALKNAEPLAAAPTRKPLLYVNRDGRVPFRDAALALFAGTNTYRIPLIDGGTTLETLRDIGNDALGGVVLSGSDADANELRAIIGNAVPLVTLDREFETLPRSIRTTREDWPAGWEHLQSAVADMQSVPLKVDGATASDLRDGAISLDGSGPVILKYGYATKWRITGGGGRIYMVSPAFLYVTGSGERRLRYGR